MTILLALACLAIDGDTLRCRIEGQLVSVRLLGIDAGVPFLFKQWGEYHWVERYGRC